MSRYGGFQADYTLDSVPSLQPQPQRHPGMSLLGRAQQFGTGLGYGLGDNLESLLRLLSDPYAGSELVGGMTQMVEHPLQTASAMGDMVQQGVSSPLNFGAMLGGLVDPGLVRSMASMAPKPVRAEMTAYHGSPHDFDAFDSSKIGTGEGAQAYGHGLYFAEDPKVAKSYASISPAVGAGTPRRFFQGKELKPGTPEYHAGTLLSQSGRTVGQVRKEVQGWIDDAAKWDAKQLADKGSQEMLAGWKKTLEVLNKAKVKSEFTHMDSGRLYNVDIPDEAIDKMLDWDAPLSEQPAQITAALRDLTDTVYEPGFYDEWLQAGGGDYRDLWRHVLAEKLDDNVISSELVKRGIPGIRYLDAGSRSAKKGTRNFVVFDDKILKILGKE